MPFINGEDSFQFLIDRSLMRPRFLLNILSHCRGFAVNLEHERIEQDDIEKGISAYSTDLIYDIDLEIRDVLPFAEDVLYNFIDCSSHLSRNEIKVLLTDADFDEDQLEKLLDIFLWYGVLGVAREDGELTYIYNVNYDVKRLKIHISRFKSEVRPV